MFTRLTWAKCLQELAVETVGSLHLTQLRGLGIRRAAWAQLSVRASFFSRSLKRTLVGCCKGCHLPVSKPHLLAGCKLSCTPTKLGRCTYHVEMTHLPYSRNVSVLIKHCLELMIYKAVTFISFVELLKSLLCGRIIVRLKAVWFKYFESQGKT